MTWNSGNHIPLELSQSLPDRLGASWPAPRRGPRGCQAGRALARLPSTKRLCRACRGLAGGQAASGKSRERSERRRTQGGAPSSAGRWRLHLFAPTSPPSLGACTQPLPTLAPFHPQAPIPLSTCNLLFSQSLETPPPTPPPPLLPSLVSPFSPCLP